MYKLLIVDDEEIEREGMVEFIPWEKYDIEVVGTAWNGLDAFEQIIEKKPDIVLTDINMPIMNGIDLIKKTKEVLDTIQFIVLSGYGEYEFTSKAMEQGVRHYVLKPCDEEKIVLVLEKVKKEIIQKGEKNQLRDNYQSIVTKMLPYAKSQIFRDILLGKKPMAKDYDFFISEIGDKFLGVAILGFRMKNGFNYIEQFVLDNIIVELLGKEFILVSTNIKNDMLFLVNSLKKYEIEIAVEKAKQVFDKFKNNLEENIYVSLSNKDSFDKINELYSQVQNLLYLGEVDFKRTLLYYDNLLDTEQGAISMFNYEKINSTKDYAGILFEIYLVFLKMKVKKYNESQKKEFYAWLLKYFHNEEKIDLENKTDIEFIEEIANIIYEKQCNKADDDIRMNNILLNIYINISNQKLSIQYLCKEVLYMNEDYFGRLFVKKQKKKFSKFLLEQRILLAKELLAFYPEVKTSYLAEIVGYSPDGQYFSKVFKKTTGYSPTEYRELIKK